VSTGLIVVFVVVALLLALALGGLAANARRERASRRPFERNLGAVDRALAEALAADRGWEPAGLEAAARRELAAVRPGEEIGALRLVQVLDRPGTDADQAVFDAELSGGRVRLTLGRRGGQWFAAAFEPAVADANG